MAEWLLALAVLAAFVPLGVIVIQRLKRSKSRAAMAGMLLLFGAFLKVDPPPPPSERVIKDEEDEPAAGAPPRT